MHLTNGASCTVRCSQTVFTSSAQLLYDALVKQMMIGVFIDNLSNCCLVTFYALARLLCNNHFGGSEGESQCEVPTIISLGNGKGRKIVKIKPFLKRKKYHIIVTSRLFEQTVYLNTCLEGIVRTKRSRIVRKIHSYDIRVQNSCLKHQMNFGSFIQIFQ